MIYMISDDTCKELDNIKFINSYRSTSVLYE